eukprot:3336493-Amphidinium_carterae.1
MPDFSVQHLTYTLHMTVEPPSGMLGDNSICPLLQLTSASQAKHACQGSEKLESHQYDNSLMIPAGAGTYTIATLGRSLLDATLSSTNQPPQHCL